ncbi:long-chain-fatty-acid--CoA ligase [Cupriavidus necator]|uniref:long-chain-fatty-acid--CoA ligase n=1 Tax=Cupriavidus necator TaxID=106590 RepID=UPI003ED069DE
MYITQGLHRSMHVRLNATAVRANGRSITFAEFGRRVACLAGALKRIGVQRDDRVAMLSLNSARYLEYLLAVPWADGVLNPVNIRWSLAEIIYSLDDSETEVLIVDDTFKELGAQILAQSKTVRHVVYAGDHETPPGMLSYEAIVASAEPVEDVRRGGDALLGIFYTGGTTGFPKGVMLSHYNMAFAMMAATYAGVMGVNATYLHAMPMFHLADYTLTAALFMSGGTHVVVPSFTPEAVLKAIHAEGVTDIMLAPTLIQMLLDWRDRQPDPRALNLSSVVSLTYGASPISPALLDRTREAFPSAAFTQGYGMTEIAAAGTALTGEYHTSEHQASGKMYSAGLPHPCVEVQVFDAEDREVPRGTIGEIVVRGPNVMVGYWRRPEETAKVLRNGWMHTGDGGYMDADGFVYVVDRLKDMVVTGGENVYSAEVEKAIASHPAVAHCAVIGIPSEKWGEMVHAIIVLKEGASATEADVVAHCRERIAGYKCPRSVEFRAALPTTSVGKVSKMELRKPFWAEKGRSVG